MTLQKFDRQSIEFLNCGGILSIADRLRELQGQRSQAEFARDCDIRQSSMATYFAGESEPNLANARKIAQANNVSLDWLANGREFEGGNRKSERTNDNLMASQSRLALLEVPMSGPSMEPTIRAGEIMMVDTSSIAIVDGGVYVVDIAGAEVCRRLHASSSGWMMLSDNKDFPPDALSKATKIIGRVIWISRKV